MKFFEEEEKKEVVMAGQVPEEGEEVRHYLILIGGRFRDQVLDEVVAINIDDGHII